jgi:hypothetical protein
MENTEFNKEIPEKNEEIIGSLFDSINYSSNEQINLLIDNMTKEQAIYCLEQAINSCHNRGAFTLLETELVSKSFRLLFNKNN